VTKSQQTPDDPLAAHQPTGLVGEVTLCLSAMSFWYAERGWQRQLL